LIIAIIAVISLILHAVRVARDRSAPANISWSRPPQLPSGVGLHRRTIFWIRQRQCGGRGDALALAVALALIAVAAVVGYEMNRRGLPIVLPRSPLLAFWHHHVGLGTPLAILSLLLGLRLQQVAAVLPRRRLLLTGWLLNFA